VLFSEASKATKKRGNVSFSSGSGNVGNRKLFECATCVIFFLDFVRLEFVCKLYEGSAEVGNVTSGHMCQG